MEILKSILDQFLNLTVTPLCRQLGYALMYKSNIEKLHTEIENLENIKALVEHSVDDGTRNGEQIEPMVDTWLKDVAATTEMARNIIAENEEKAQTTCFCLNFISRHKLGRNAINTMNAASELQEYQNKIVHFTYRVPVEGIGMVDEDYEHFESRKPTFEAVMEALRNPDVNMVGLHGMGGVGKTTLVKQVSEKAKEEHLFETVVIVEVSNNPVVKEIQGVIADKLDLRFIEESIPGRADRLYYRLSKEKKVLIVLDDIWERLDLKAVGIPVKMEMSKIIITSRDENVLSRMEAQIHFTIGILTEDEAWNLFKKISGNCVENSNLQPIAFEIAKRCAGFPITIVSVATTLKDKNSPEWRNALREIQSLHCF